MATLTEVQDFLDIEIEDKRLRPGKKYKNKNKYYYYENQYYIVQLTQGKWMIAEDCKKTRRLLRLYCWGVDSYPETWLGKKHKRWHQLFLNYEKGLVADHINRHKFDNRFDNLRVVTYVHNNRNTSKSKNNTSGKQGVSRCTFKQKSGHANNYWSVRITDNEGKRVVKYFSIEKFGEYEAKRLAIAKRLELENLYGYSGE